MSRNSKETITCPKCNTKGDFTVWGSLNVNLDPKMKEKVLDYSIFKYTCPNCGETFNIQYDFLYHDMNRKYMIQMVTEEERMEEVVNNFVEVKKTMKKEFAKENFDEKVRVVLGPNELKEKILIFDNNLDDRAIEKVKTVILSSLCVNANNEDKTPNKALFDIGNNGKMFFAIFYENEYLGTVNFEEELYNKINEALEKENDNLYIVDQYYAIQSLGLEKLANND